jgi:hypothetical protein
MTPAPNWGCRMREPMPRELVFIGMIFLQKYAFPSTPFQARHAGF